MLRENDFQYKTHIPLFNAALVRATRYLFLVAGIGKREALPTHVPGRGGSWFACDYEWKCLQCKVSHVV